MGWRQFKVERGKKRNQNFQKRQTKYKDVEMMNYLAALNRMTDWMGLPTDEKKRLERKEWKYWVEQLQTQNAMNGKSYKRKGAGIIGKDYSLSGKIDYLIDWIEELEQINN